MAAQYPQQSQTQGFIKPKLQKQDAKPKFDSDPDMLETDRLLPWPVLSGPLGTMLRRITAKGATPDEEYAAGEHLGASSRSSRGFLAPLKSLGQIKEKTEHRVKDAYKSVEAKMKKLKPSLLDGYEKLD
ncbi:hypothetical protein CDD81_4357 [Ophiocordyceps australis]|uniref:Uncharacterized protein n=1 Tax=Ophiocordyceps australis TaxID=1399860 RepID=A0A2C5X710_9HYPO|nr:hypothetical protein CDD81_4357 [Ophiocordyceps australis]